MLNAGSSSLKFCVYRAANAEWQLETRGQIDGIGTAPKFTAKNGQGEKIADERLDGRVTDARTALDSLAAWLRERHRGARVLAVGHRVVHGGARYAGPIVVTPQILEDLRTLIPLAPLHQPYNLAAIEAVFERLPGVPQVACFDTSFHRGQPPSRRSFRCRARSVRPVCSATGSTGCRTNTSPRSCRKWRRRSPPDA